ncbi:hypothetical protein A5821_002074 [Enterococcus sp. 7F3_DIV0205]|uniref:WxL domain-containing protein n=1 Tax=Candidatus Enterococcus palustris TaxID=1834189 RepID=A0AAQ3W9A0_9ENTE|nr:WxL domain-containing protein [Enterococcus sp. 7F3_DIV0205]OTN82513.1 hypothetical protein A5821_002424 [Enterococcus sp. 7F3_DIV0205]
MKHKNKLVIFGMLLIGIISIGSFYLENTTIKAEDEIEQANQVHRTTVTPKATFEGRIAQVYTGEQLKNAVNDWSVKQIELMNDVKMTYSIHYVNRNLVIRGNGYKLDAVSSGFQVESGDFTFRLENIVLAGASLEKPLLNYKSDYSGPISTVEMENVSEGANNQSPITNLQYSNLVFTGGKNIFNNTKTKFEESVLFSQAKMTIQGGAQVSINQKDMKVISGFEEGDFALYMTEKSKLIINTTKFDSINPKTNIVIENASEINIAGGSTLDISAENSEKTQSIPIINFYSNRNYQLPAMIKVSEESELSIHGSDLRTGISMSTYKGSEIDVTNAKLNIATEKGNGIYMGQVNGSNATGSKITAQNGGQIALKGSGKHVLEFQIKEPQVNISKNSRLDIQHETQEDTSSVYMNGQTPKMMVSDNSQVNLVASRNGIQLSGDRALFKVEGGSKVFATVDQGDSIQLEGGNPSLEVSGKETILKGESNRLVQRDGRATIYLGKRDAETYSEGARITISDEAQVDLIANKSSAMVMQSTKGVFDLTTGAKLMIKSGETYGDSSIAAASLRFMRSGQPSLRNGHYTFNIDNAELTIEKTGGNAATLRLFGFGNQVNVKNNGKFVVNNPGSGTVSNGGSGDGNQGIHYTTANGIGAGDVNKFSVEDEGSEVRINADYGPAIDMDEQKGSIIARNDGYFEARGQTASSNVGIFRTTNRLEVLFDKPFFMDFSNTRPGGGNILQADNLSTLTAIESDLSLWKKGTSIEQDPDLNFRDLDYGFEGENFKDLAATNRPEDFNVTTIGTEGLTNYTRLSSNNARWAVADVLRVPTTADKKIHGRVSLPVGLNRTRPAWDDEAEVTVEVQRANGEKEVYEKVKSVGDSKAKPGISIYGEKPQGGLFEIDTGKYFEVGDKVTITKVNLTSGELTPGFDNQILTKTVEPFQIIPPKPITVESNAINNQATSIKGHVEDRTVEFTATLNGQPLDTSSVVVDEMGNFELSLEAMTLKEGDEIQLFARDHEGSALKAGVVNPPITNNDTGNSNPSQKLTFHDTSFEAAPTINVSELMPLSVLFQDENGQAIHKTLTMFKEPNESVDLTKEEQITSAIQTLKKQEYNLFKKPKPEVIIMNEAKTVIYQFMGPTEELISDKEPQTDEFAIRAVSDFKFPHVPIGTTRAIKLDKLTPEPSEGAKGYSSGIEVADMSGTAKGWSVSVAMTTPLQTTEGKELKGWELYIPTEKVKSGGVETKDAIGHTVTVTKEGATGSVFSAAQGKGKGRFADIFESYTEEATTEEGLTRKKGVQLTVPSGAYKGAYQGKLTWTLQNVPN